MACQREPVEDFPRRRDFAALGSHRLGQASTFRQIQAKILRPMNRFLRVFPARRLRLRRSSGSRHASLGTECAALDGGMRAPQERSRLQSVPRDVRGRPPRMSAAGAGAATVDRPPRPSRRRSPPSRRSAPNRSPWPTSRRRRPARASAAGADATPARAARAPASPSGEARAARPIAAAGGIDRPRAGPTRPGSVDRSYSTLSRRPRFQARNGTPDSSAESAALD